MSFSFKDQLVVGSRGEELLLKHYHSPLIIIPDHYADFKRISDGRIVELKTDTYNMEKTPNFFFERWSDFEKKKPGGVWQSSEHRVHTFIYYFVRHNTYFEFELKPLLKFLQPFADKKDEKGGWIFVKNKGWITAGFTLPREQLKHLYTQYTFDPTEEK
jgi:hypothetical protein